jgi:hypothetical protein
VPTQLVVPGNRLPNYQPASFIVGNACPGGLLSNGPSGGPHGYNTGTPYDLQFYIPSGVGGVSNVVVDHALRDFFILTGNALLFGVPVNGQSAPSAVRIRDNITVSGILHVYPYTPIEPVSLAGFTYVLVYPQLPATNDPNQTPGFPDVPPPENGV